MLEKAAAELMGEPVIAGSMVMPKGFNTKYAAGMGVGGLVGAAIATSLKTSATTPGGHRGRMFVALGPTKLAFFELKAGPLRAEIGRVLQEVPRGEVTSFELGGRKLMAGLKVTLSDGTLYELEVSRFRKRKQAGRIATELAGAAGA